MFESAHFVAALRGPRGLVGVPSDLRTLRDQHTLFRRCGARRCGGGDRVGGEGATHSEPAPSLSVPAPLLRPLLRCAAFCRALSAAMLRAIVWASSAPSAGSAREGAVRRREWEALSSVSCSARRADTRGRSALAASLAEDDGLAPASATPDGARGLSFLFCRKGRAQA